MTNNYPHYIRAHNSKNHADISSKYAIVKDNIDSIVSNPITTNAALSGLAKPIYSTNKDFGSMLTDEVTQQTMQLSGSLPLVASALYGDFSPDIYGKADFLDKYETLTDPGKALDHIASCTATSTQLQTLQNYYPSLWQEYVSQTLYDVSTESLHPTDRAHIYGYTGIETHPAVSYKALMTDAMAKMEAKEQGQKTQTSQGKGNRIAQPSKKSQELPSMYGAPFTSPRGRLP